MGNVKAAGRFAGGAVVGRIARVAVNELLKKEMPARGGRISRRREAPKPARLSPRLMPPVPHVDLTPAALAPFLAANAPAGEVLRVSLRMEDKDSPEDVLAALRAADAARLAAARRGLEFAFWRILEAPPARKLGDAAPSSFVSSRRTNAIKLLSGGDSDTARLELRDFGVHPDGITAAWDAAKAVADAGKRETLLAVLRLMRLARGASATAKSANPGAFVERAVALEQRRTPSSSSGVFSAVAAVFGALSPV